MSAQATSGHRHPAPVKWAALRGFASLNRVLAGLLLVSAIFFGHTANAQTASCTCRYKGENFSLGETICLKSADGMRMATCSMVLNNTSWQFSNAPCPLTRLEPDGIKAVIENMTPMEKPGKAS